MREYQAGDTGAVDLPSVSGRAIADRRGVRDRAGSMAVPIGHWLVSGDLAGMRAWVHQCAISAGLDAAHLPAGPPASGRDRGAGLWLIGRPGV
ncbi:hypothetical protein [Planobispora rosea]|uniref:Uncharacterized protein n=1 Tax=Planobispora rosea TaxID=35762 RepID=A0A8J3WAP2_PLARO|nr:hypothetical protein [Planobispora rosea]GIH82098.1 hypothetical protein Pro02_05060 [Planobispora rosea]